MIRTCTAATLVLHLQTCMVQPQLNANDRRVCVRKPWLVPPPHQRTKK